LSDSILAAVGSNLRLLARVREVLARQTPLSLADIQSALERSDARALYLAAHKLKGSVSNFPGAAVIDIAAAVEAAAAEDDLDRARQLVPQLSVALDELLARIDVALRGSAPHP